MKILLAISLTLMSASFAISQPDVELWDKPFTLSIQDNAYFVEEAFNQEDRVVQHILALQYVGDPDKLYEYNFTQEWPMWGALHQFSYTLPYTCFPGTRGIGDIMLNYRYQLLDKIDGIAMAPRFSIILPTGDDTQGLGSGTTGFEFNLPVSKRLTEALVMHANAGASLLPSLKGTTLSGALVEKGVSSYWIGASGIVLIDPNANFMLEYLAESAGEIDQNGDVVFSTRHVVSPGMRAAINLDNLQIVPGVAIPIFFADGKSTTGVFGYVSFEHGF